MTGPGSQLITALERTWAAIQRKHPEVPDVLIITGQGDKGRSITRGHFAADRWRPSGPGRPKKGETLHELFVGGERLADGAEQVLQTMLHEAAHGLAVKRGIQDTSRQGRYHNRRFVKLSEELGLKAPKAADGTRGLTAVTITPETTERYATQITALQAAITHHLGKVRATEAGAKPKHVRLPRVLQECGCTPPRQLRGPAEELGDLHCGRCSEPFAEVAK